MLLKVLQFNTLDATYDVERFLPICPAAPLEWKNRKERIEKLISDEKPDVICLCEVHSDFPVSIDLEEYTVDYLRKGNSFQGLLVAVNNKKLKIRKTLKEFFSTRQGELQNQNYFYLELETLESRFVFALFSSHLKAGERFKAERLSQAMDIVGMVTTSTLPHIVLGDFNAEPNERSIKHIMDYLELKSVNPDLFTAFKVKSPENIIKKKVDYVLYSRDFHLVSSSNYQSKCANTENKFFFDYYPSDHIPTVAVFGVVAPKRSKRKWSR